jgi:hypothetical protein
LSQLPQKHQIETILCVFYISFSSIVSEKNETIPFQKTNTNDDQFGLDLSKAVHSFVVIDSDQKSGCLKVCESTEHGLSNGEIKIGQEKWTSLVLFVPKKEEIRTAVVKWV